MTGEPGTGKTTLLHLLTSALDATVPVVYIHHPPQTFAEFVFTLCDHLSLQSSKDTTEAQLDLLEDYLRARAFRGDPVVLLIDNAHRLDPSALGHLETLLGSRGSNKDRLQMILAGQPQLEMTLKLPEVRTLAKRVATHCRLSRLTDEEVSTLYPTPSSTAGWTQENSFSPAAIARIAHHSRSHVSQRINAICDSAIRAAYAAGHKTISESLIEEVVPSLQFARTGDPQRCCSFYRGHLISNTRMTHVSPDATKLARLARLTDPSATDQPQNVCGCTLGISPPRWILRLEPDRFLFGRGTFTACAGGSSDTRRMELVAIHARTKRTPSKLAPTALETTSQNKPNPSLKNRPRFFDHKYKSPRAHPNAEG